MLFLSVLFLCLRVIAHDFPISEGSHNRRGERGARVEVGGDWEGGEREGGERDGGLGKMRQSGSGNRESEVWHWGMEERTSDEGEGSENT
jgi:hypothetical protein